MNFRTILQRFWAALMLPPTLLGLWYFPSDFTQSLSRDVAAPWQTAISLVNREVLLWLMCFGLSGWAIWTEVRPYILDRLRIKGPIGVQSDLFCETELIDGVSAYRVRVYIVVSNKNRNRNTLKNVAANFFLIGDAVPLYVRRSSADRRDLRHGEHILFEVGSLISSQIVGLVQPGGDPIDERERTQIEHNLPNGHLSLRVGRENNMSIGNPAGVELTDFPFYVVVSADDVASTALKINMNLQNLPDLSAAFRVTINPK
jgi:hypothetical protein